MNFSIYCMFIDTPQKNRFILFMFQIDTEKITDK